MENKLTNRTQSKRSKDLIYFNCKLSSISQDIIQLFTAQITDEDKELHSYEVKIGDIEKKLGKRLNSLEIFKTLEEELFKPVFEFKNGAVTDKFGWCSKLSRNDDTKTLTIQMHPELKEHLIALKQNKVSFTIIDTDYFLKLKNTYSKRLYTIFKYWAGIAELRQSIFINVSFEINEFIDLLRLTPSLSLYKNMKNRVLLTAIEEINKFTDIAVALNETKKSDSVNSKVTELNFIVTNKEVFKKTEKQISKKTKENEISGNTLNNVDLWELNYLKNECEVLDCEVIEDKRNVENSFIFN